MRVLKHIGLSKRIDYELWAYIKANNIQAKHKEDEDLATVDLYADSKHWPWIQEYIASHSVLCLSDTEFTQEELQDTQWMRVRSMWRYGYPEPSEDYAYEDITYSRDTYCAHCSVGLKQVDAFRMKKPPSWGRRHFFSLYWVEDELFVSDTVKQIFQAEGVTGVSFLPVQNKTGSKEYEEIHQLYISHILSSGLIENDEYLKKITICPKCGTKKFCGNGSGKQQYKQEVFLNAPNIVKTGDYFGGMPGIAAHEIIINQKVYQIIIRHHLDRGLKLDPIDLV